MKEASRVATFVFIACYLLFSCSSDRASGEYSSGTDSGSALIERETIEIEKKIRNDTVVFPKAIYDRVVAYSMKKHYIPFSDEKNFPPSLNGFGFISPDLKIIGSQVNSKILDSTQINRLFKAIRASAIGSSITTSCIPANRDAVIFYKNKKPVGVIAICFDCGKIYFHPRADFAIGDSGWAQLESLFADLGIQGYKQEKAK